jgi:hypothetical protein
MGYFSEVLLETLAVFSVVWLGVGVVGTWYLLTALVRRFK